MRLSKFLFVAAAASAFSTLANAAGDETRGKVIHTTKCGICHSLEANGIGPSHKGLFGRKAGIIPGYDYSPGVKASKVVWDEKTLDQWLAFPENVDLAGVRATDARTAVVTTVDGRAFGTTDGGSTWTRDPR